ncbi:MAG TPA: hypothetical protein VFO58_25210 [Vicinamibacterales bacterium]|nr:hypothetical protein [Vicinamibacterales bacterium]
MAHRDDELNGPSGDDARPVLFVQWWAVVTEPFLLLRERLRGERCPNCHARVRDEHGRAVNAAPICSP